MCCVCSGAWSLCEGGHAVSLFYRLHSVKEGTLRYGTSLNVYQIEPKCYVE